MESSPASLTATHVYLPESSIWALGICSTRPPEIKAVENVYGLNILHISSLPYSFRHLSHLAGSELCHSMSADVRLCTK